MSTQSCCFEKDQHTAQVSAASVPVYTARGGGGSSSWLPNCSAPCVCVGRARFEETASRASAQLVHSWESSNNICWLHNVWVRDRIRVENVGIRKRRADKKIKYNKTRGTLMDNFWHFESRPSTQTAYYISGNLAPMGETQVSSSSSWRQLGLTSWATHSSEAGVQFFKSTSIFLDTIWDTWTVLST